MTIEELARERVKLQATLEAINLWNTYGKTIDDLTKVEIKRIEALKALKNIEEAIKVYISG